MKTKLISIGARLGVVGSVGCLLLLLTGCLEYDDTSSPSTGTQAPPPLEQVPAAEGTPESETEAAPPPAAPIGGADVFRYEPGPTSTRIYVPRQFGMWNLSIVSLRPHVQLWGPTRTSAYPVVIPIGGAEFARRASSVSSGPGILIHAKTSHERTGNQADATWRIPDPTRSYVGDETRVQPGERPH